MDEPGMDETGIDEPGMDEPRKAPTRSHWLWEVVETVAIALVLAFLIRNFVMESFLVQGTSMYPTLHDGERLLVNKFVYRFRDPEPGEIVVFQYPLNPSRDFIKRVIAGPGDRVRIEEGVVYVNDRPMHETYVYQQDRYFMPEQLVPPGHVFVLGDNRMNSEDSRTFGTVSSHLMVGRAFVVYWPPEDMRRVTDGTEVMRPPAGSTADPGRPGSFRFLPRERGVAGEPVDATSGGAAIPGDATPVDATPGGAAIPVDATGLILFSPSERPVLAEPEMLGGRRGFAELPVLTPGIRRVSEVSSRRGAAAAGAPASISGDSLSVPSGFHR